MDFTTLQYYITVCELKSITKAAEKHYISRQAISKSIGKLESDLGASLIVARHNGVELTEEGQFIYRNALKLFGEWNAMLGEFESLKRAHRRIIRVGYGQTTYNLWNIDHVEQFKMRNPNIDVIVEIMPPDQLLDGLKSRFLDMALTSAFSDDPCFAVATIMRLPLKVLMCIDDPYALQPSIGVNDLMDRDIYFVPGNKTFFDAFVNFLRSEQINANCKYASESGLFTLFNTIKQNHGLYFTSGIFTNLLNNPDEFVSKPFVYNGPHKMPNKNIHAITLRDTPSNAAVKCYVNFLRAIKPIK